MNQNKLRVFFSARQKVLNNLKSRLFPLKSLNEISTCETTFETGFQIAPESTPETANATKATKAKTKRKISSLKLP